MLKLLMLIWAFQTVTGNSQYEEANVNLNFPDTCFSADFSRSLRRGERQSIGSCEFVQCIMMDASLYWLTHKCDPIYQVPDNCKIAKDDEAVYPGCCPKLVCQ
ncbi:hypothetical protein CHUAL_012027 [Chamberlinius hualienensis]